MRLIKVILLLFLIVKSSIAADLSVAVSAGCCHTDSESTEIIDDKNSDQDDEKGCCDLVCDCICCGHTFLNEQLHDLQFVMEDIPSSDIIEYYNEYRLQFNANIWHPPRLV